MISLPLSIKGRADSNYSYKGHSIIVMYNDIALFPRNSTYLNSLTFKAYQKNCPTLSLFQCTTKNWNEFSQETEVIAT